MLSLYSCAWHGDVNSFLAVDERAWGEALCTHHQRCMLEVANPGQKRAWHHCFLALREQLSSLVQQRSEAAAWHLIFEYELPRERGRRPDVILLAGHTVWVLEFKDDARANRAYIDQVAAYARDLQNYRAASHTATVRPVLVLTQSVDHPTTIGSVRVLRSRDLAYELVLTEMGTAPPLNPEQWLSSDYAPLPSLVHAARTIFQHESLPQIRRAHSAGIPETVADLTRIAEEAQAVTGVPGAGKTLVGLQFVYSTYFDCGDGSRAAVFLSGNGPLVKVLQHALKSRVFVQDVHGFLKTYGGNQSRVPEEDIWVYDEAQRAWDAARVQEKRGHGASEPEDFLRLGARKNSWALMVGLIGEGQEIHLGEEAGLQQWNEAIRALSSDWIVHCPHKVKPVFTAARKVIGDDRLDLNISLRSHLAEDVQLWVKQLLEGDLDRASVTAQQVRHQGFDLYLTQDLEAAKTYVRQRYDHNLDKRYGLLASSKAKNLDRYGVRNGFQFTKRLREGPWYNDPIDSPDSCCQLREVATEFACQGLELDFRFWHGAMT